MRLSLRPLTLALLMAGFAGTAGAADLMDAYELARQGDPQLAAVVELASPRNKDSGPRCP